MVATAGPAIASLTGDYFPARERGRIYAYILGGEIAGNAVGFIVCGNVATAIGWQAAFVLLAIPGFFLARELYRTVPEPLRGGQSHLEPGAEDLVGGGRLPRSCRVAGLGFGADWLEDEEVPPAERISPSRRRAAWGSSPIRSWCSPRTRARSASGSRCGTSSRSRSNVMMIISSSLGYFFFSGLTTSRWCSCAVITASGALESDLVLALLVGGALIGTLVSGWLGDLLLRRGMLTSRIWLPAVCYLGAALLLIPGFVSTHLTPALWFDVAGAALVSAANPPLDAARLDIMPAGLWGRAESVRTVVRSLAQALAPLIFGLLASVIAGFYPSQAPIGTHPAPAPSVHAAHGLEITFLLHDHHAGGRRHRAAARAPPLTRATSRLPAPPTRAPLTRSRSPGQRSFSCDGRPGRAPIARAPMSREAGVTAGIDPRPVSGPTDKPDVNAFGSRSHRRFTRRSHTRACLRWSIGLVCTHKPKRRIL